jgi:hypothetical protein
MPEQRFALEPGGPKRVQVAWGMTWNKVRVSIDGAEVGTIATKKELKAGVTFLLADGSTLGVRLGGLLAPTIEVSRNGSPLPGSSADPAQRLRSAYGLLFLLGSFNIAVGTLATIITLGPLQALGIDGTSAAIGAVYLLLGFLVRRRFAVALAVAMLVLSLDLIVTLVAAVSVAPAAFAGVFFARLWFILVMFRGFGAVGTLKRQATAIARSSPA